MFGKNQQTLPQSVEKRIGYRFKKKALLETALTHPSYRYENPDVPEDNQRLEFLGDSVLGFLAADQLTEAFPEADEGELTKRKSGIASGKNLAACAREIQLGEFIRFGKGETASGGAKRESNLEDAFEALIGAIWLDGGLKAARRFFQTHVFKTLEAAAPVVSNPKGTLQEFAQRKGFDIPAYQVTDESGPDHARHFKVEVTVHNSVFRGEGASRREAERNAAHHAVDSLIR